MASGVGVEAKEEVSGDEFHPHFTTLITAPTQAQGLLRGGQRRRVARDPLSALLAWCLGSSSSRPNTTRIFHQSGDRPPTPVSFFPNPPTTHQASTHNMATTASTTPAKKEEEAAALDLDLLVLDSPHPPYPAWVRPAPLLPAVLLLFSLHSLLPGTLLAPPSFRQP